MQKLTLIKKSTAIFALLALIAGSFGLASFQVAHAAGTYAIPQEAPAYTINPSATGVDTLKAFIETPGVTFANPGFTNLDPSWTASTINPTYAVETGPSSAFLAEDLNIAVGAPAVTVNVYAFTASTLTDAYQVTFTDGNYNGFTTGPSATTLAAENTTPAPSVVTNAATPITSTDATLNGTNGNSASTDSSFWASTSTFVTTSPSLPTGVFSTPSLGPIAANTAYSASLSSITGLLPITPSTTYYFAAWTNVGGTWYPGNVMSFSTSPTVTVSSPTITTIAPNSGTTVGGTPVTITGTQFATGATVKINGVAATSVTFVSPTSITATTPAGTAGAQNVVVTNTDTGTATSTGGFTYVTPVVTVSAPTITSVAPNSGLTVGGSPVIIIGTQFAAGATVTIGGALATDLTVTPTSITAKTPAGTAGAQDVVVTNTDTGTATLTGGFTYVDPAPGTGTITGTVTSDAGLSVDSITASPNNANGIADGTWAHGWSYVFHITAPTNEPNLTMKFADWLNGANILPVANNMRISSAQATVTTPITLTAANLYSSPALVMTGDLNNALAGRQVDVLVEVQIPPTTVNGSYSTSYGINTN